MSGFYDDPTKLDVPAAERLVRAYLRRTKVTQTTTVEVLAWSDYENSAHNRRRVHLALETMAEPAGAGHHDRTVFQLTIDPEGSDYDD